MKIALYRQFRGGAMPDNFVAGVQGNDNSDIEIISGRTPREACRNAQKACLAAAARFALLAKEPADKMNNEDTLRRINRTKVAP